MICLLEGKVKYPQKIFSSHSKKVYKQKKKPTRSVFILLKTKQVGKSAQLAILT